MKKLISIVLAVIFIVSALPFSVGAATVTDSKSVTNWTISVKDDVTAVVASTEKEVKSGSVALNISSKQKQGGTITISQTVAMEIGKTYVYGYDAKATKVANAQSMLNTANKMSMIPFGTTWGWQPFEHTYKATAASMAYKFVITGSCGELVIDNVYMYEYDPATHTKIGENMIKNGGFEERAASATATVDGLNPKYHRTAEEMGVTDTTEYTELGKSFVKAKHIPVYRADEIVIDGSDDEWDKYTRIPIEMYGQIGEGKVTLTGNYRYAWDDSYLYAYYEFDDDVHHYSEGNYWDQDSMQFMFGALNEDYGREFGFYLDDIGAVNISGVTEGEILCSIVREGTKTKYEFGISWNLHFDSAPKAALLSGLANDNDNDGYGRKGWLETSNVIAATGKNAMYCQMYHFLNEGDTFCTWLEGEEKITSGEKVNYTLSILNLSDAEQTYNVTTSESTKNITVASNEIGTTEIIYNAGSYGLDKVETTVKCGTQSIENSLDIEIVVNADDFTAWAAKMEEQIEKIKTLINECVEKNIPVDYARKDYFILSEFLGFLKQDHKDKNYEHMNNNMPLLDEICENAIANLEAYLSGEKEAYEVPRFKTGTLEAHDGGYYADMYVDGKLEEDRPLYLVGYGHFAFAEQYMKQYDEMGMNSIQIGIKAYDVLQEKIVSDYWSISKQNGFIGDADVVTDAVHSGKYAVRFKGDPESPGGFLWFSQTFNVEPDTEYTYGLWAKGEGCERIWFYGNGVPSAGRKHFAGTSGWTKHTYTYKTAPTETEVKFLVQMEKPGNAVIDDVFFGKTGTDENLVLNSGFENGPGPEKEPGKPYVVSRTAIEALKKKLEDAEKDNVAVTVGVQLSSSTPAFYYDVYPEIYENGKFHHYVPYNPTHPKVYEIAQDLYDAVIPEIKDYKSLKSIIVSNEPSFQAALSDYYAPMWPEYLKKLYDNDINKLNEKYKSNYEKFEDIIMPRINSSAPVFYDYMVFNREILTEYHRTLTQMVKKHAPDIPVHANFMDNIRRDGAGDLYRGWDYIAATEFFDIHGCDGIDMLDEDNLRTSMSKLLWYDRLRGADPTMPIFNTEDHVTRDTNTDFSPRVANLFARSLWMGALHGRMDTVLWLWQRNRASSFYGASVCYRPDVVNNQATLALDLNRLAREVRAISDKTPDVAILHAETSQTANAPFSNTLSQIYDAIHFAGQSVRIVHERVPERMNDADLLIITDATHVLPETLDNIISYMKNGGRVVIFGEDSLKLDQYKNENDPEKVKWIFDNAKSIIPITTTKTALASPAGTQLFDKINEILADNGKDRVKLVNAETGEPEYEIGWLYTEYDGNIIISGMAWDFYANKDIKIIVDGKEAQKIVDLRTDKVYNGVVNLEACEAVVLKVIE